MTIQDYAAIAASAFALLTACFVGWQVRKMAESISLQRLQSQHLLCIEIWREYEKVFSDRQALLEHPLTIDSLLRKYEGTTEIVAGEEYKRLKRVAGVYMLAGSLVKAGAISPSAIFDYISVPGKMWKDHEPLILYLRRTYYPNLWIHWQHLTELPENRWSITSTAGTDTPEQVKSAAP